MELIPLQPFGIEMESLFCQLSREDGCDLRYPLYKKYEVVSKEYCAILWSKQSMARIHISL